jgi:hypothetical protein
MPAPEINTRSTRRPTSGTNPPQRTAEQAASLAIASVSA